jgi:hypothetical protein
MSNSKNKEKRPIRTEKRTEVKLSKEIAKAERNKRFNKIMREFDEAISQLK